MLLAECIRVRVRGPGIWPFQGHFWLKSGLFALVSAPALFLVGLEWPSKCPAPALRLPTPTALKPTGVKSYGPQDSTMSDFNLLQ